MRTRGSSGDPEVSRSPEVIFEPCDCIRDPEVSLDHEVLFGTRRSLFRSWGFFDRSGDHGWNPEVFEIVIRP